MSTIGTFLASLVTGSNSLPVQTTRLRRAYRRALKAHPTARTDDALRRALVAESVAGAYDDPDSGQLAEAYAAWRAGVSQKSFERDLRRASRLRLRRRSRSSK
jgi:hypothetical protein